MPEAKCDVQQVKTAGDLERDSKLGKRKKYRIHAEYGACSPYGCAGRNTQGGKHRTARSVARCELRDEQDVCSGAEKRSDMEKPNGEEC